MLTLADLVEGITGQRPTEGVVPQLELSEVVIDSREACPNSLFVALRGERRDGHDFVADAFARGAVAAIVDREVDAECQVVDARSPLPKVPIRPPVCLMAEDSLKAFQRLSFNHFRKRAQGMRQPGKRAQGKQRKTGSRRTRQ